MSNIDEIVDSIQKKLQSNGLNTIMDEVAKIESSISDLQDMVNNLESCGDFDGVVPVKNFLRASKYELSNCYRSIGQPEQIINEVVQRIKNA